VAGKAVLRWSVEAFWRRRRDIVIVTTEDGEKALPEVLRGLSGWRAARGGATRALSVQSGLAALANRPEDEPVLIHDAARPFLTGATIEGVLKALTTADAALPPCPSPTR
jgi:2-C-methyl-D-erythritol 4-phosphate cytidylyltransferase/2-C-methyl-D-erythritol 2,4-cyclodiphosphate synthase